MVTEELTKGRTGKQVEVRALMNFIMIIYIMEIVT